MLDKFSKCHFISLINILGFEYCLYSLQHELSQGSRVSEPLFQYFCIKVLIYSLAFSVANGLFDSYLCIYLFIKFFPQCYGASEDRRLEIPGEKEHVTSAREFVGWYNGLPENRNLQMNLSNKKKAVIVGVGNVALDIARILLSPIHLLEKTDISPYALEALKKSSLKQVEILGRRGPFQVSYTIKELRELINLEDVQHVFNINDFQGVDEDMIKSKNYKQ